MRRSLPLSVGLGLLAVVTTSVLSIGGADVAAPVVAPDARSAAPLTESDTPAGEAPAAAVGADATVVAVEPVSAAVSATTHPPIGARPATAAAATPVATAAAATEGADQRGEVVADEYLGEVAAAGASRPSAKRPATTTTTTTAPVVTVPTTTLWADNFNALTGSGWTDGSVHGGWQVEYNGYGNVGAATDGSGVLQTRPMASSSPGETHGAMVLSTQSFSGNVDVELRMRTVQQLRTGTPPNPWEVGWAVWHYGGSEHFYYLALKPNGWELGKSDNTKLDPNGPVCTWPSYVNCRYEGAQRYLATGSSPTFAVGSWHTARIVQVGSSITVYGDGRLLGTTVDLENPFSSGRVGLYTEDAHVHFDDLQVRRA